MIKDKQISKLYKQSLLLNRQVEKAAKKYIDYTHDNRCIICGLYGDSYKIPLSEKHKKCKNCAVFEKIKFIFYDYLALKTERDNFNLNVYARYVYDYLSSNNPMIYDAKGKGKLFIQLFNKPFSKLSDGDKYTLIAIIEGESTYTL